MFILQELRTHTQSSLREHFLKKIYPTLHKNYEKYGLTKDEVDSFPPYVEKPSSSSSSCSITASPVAKRTNYSSVQYSEEENNCMVTAILNSEPDENPFGISFWRKALNKVRIMLIRSNLL